MRDVAIYGDRLDRVTVEAEEVILLVQEARQVVELAVAETAGRG